MTYTSFLKIIKRFQTIAEENEMLTCDLAVTIRTTSGQQIKALAEEVNYMDDEILEIFTDDSYKFIPYSNIESVAI